MSSFDVIAAQFKKTYGDGIGGKAPQLPEMPRIPTGIFAIDLQTGGGIPKGKITEIYGKEGSCKTNVCLSTIAEHQRLFPNEKCAFIDVEGTFDPDWATKFGINYDELYMFRPDYAEQVVDMVEALLCADDCGLIVVDSLAAMVTIREAGQSAEKTDMGGEALAVKKLVKKATKAMIDNAKEGRFTTLILINQTRSKIGVMYGSPETTPGGSAKNFFASMRIRIYGSEVMDAKISKLLPIRKKITVRLDKWKCKVVAKSSEFEMVMIPHNGMPVGYTSEWNVIKTYMEDYGFFKKNPDGKGYLMFDEPYDTIKACKEHVQQDKEFGDLVKKMIIERAKEEVEGAKINEQQED